VERLNIVILQGRLTADPELKHTSNGTAVCSFTLAVDRPYQKDGEKQADFFTLVAWRNTAEFCSKYLYKGQLVAAEGSIQTREYTDKEGNKRKAYEVVVNKIHPCAWKKNEDTEQSGFVEVEDDSDLPF
jgi:single-strand DNA-binding protein